MVAPIGDDPRRPGDEDLWQEATQDVRRDEDPRRDERLPQRRRRIPLEKEPEEVSAPRGFDVAIEDDTASGRQPDFPVKELRRLQRGEPPFEETINLRHLRVENARGTLEQAIPAARRRGVRCLLVITGRGSSVPGSGVIRRALPGWLSRGVLAEHVNAFANALPGDGGVGAFYVLLRR